MKIECVEVNGLARSMFSAGLPKSNGIDPAIPSCLEKLGRAKAGSGHDCFLKGVDVYHKITADHSFWIQWLRYHFHDIVSSTSKMHTILNGEFQFDPLVTEASITEFERLRSVCLENNTPENFERLIMNSPMGLLLTAECKTNYLQLKTIYAQRKNHKMSSWREYCKWIESLPEFIRLTQRNE